MLRDSEILRFAADVMASDVDSLTLRAVSGGDINQCYGVVGSSGERVFIKSNQRANLLCSEYASLRDLHRLGLNHYPTVLGFESDPSGAMLALEYVDLSPFDNKTAASAATVLAKQHKITANRFGWHRDGYIGFSPQTNIWEDDWARFFTQRRLAPQLRLALKSGLSADVASLVEKVMRQFEQRLDCSSIKPSLLHGDLWFGNLSYVAKTQRPLFYDPAPYYGDPEADIAMTTMFGALPSSFYRTYRALIPEPPDYQFRSSVYNLYHALNHVSMFGTGYQNLVSALCHSAL